MNDPKRRIYPSLTQAMKLANVGLMASGNAAHDRNMERSPYTRAYVEAANTCAAAPSQLENAVLNGIKLTEEQYAWLKNQTTGDDT